MLAVLWSTVELSWGPAAEERNSPGVMVLLLFLGAVTVIAAGQYMVPPTIRRKVVEALSAFSGVTIEESKKGRYLDPRFLPKGTEKRTNLRRSGHSVPVWISESPDGASKKDALVLDRSRGGLQIAVEESSAVGSHWYVRSHDAPDGLEWIQLEVRNCRNRNGQWLLGCKFSRELPWGVILMFG